MRFLTAGGTPMVTARLYGFGLEPAVAINADADLVLVAAVDRFHPTVADRADLNHLAGLSLRLVSVVEGIHSTQRQVVSTLLHLT